MRTILVAMLMTSMGCSSIEKLAMRSATPLMVSGADKFSHERNWELFREAMPGNLKFYEVLYLQDIDNLELLGAVVKGYAAYAFGVAETLAMSDEFDGFDDSYNKQNAIALYTRALDYGLDYMQKKGVKRNDLLTFSESDLKKKLSKTFDRKDYKVMLYTAQAWGSLIKLQKENLELAAHTPKAKFLFDWVCSKDDSIENGVCDIYFAEYAAGFPEKSKQLYIAAINKRPLSLLIRISYIQNIVLPAKDVGAYEAEARILKDEFLKWGNLNRDKLDDNSDYKSQEHLNLFNAIAQKRFYIIEKNKKKIFEG